MYRFAISYYIMNGVTRIPLSGVTIRLVRPGDTFLNGVKLSEKPTGSGYYETEVLSESFWGFYEVWDDRVDPNGSFSGKTCTVGKLDARGIKDSAIYSNHILNEAITPEKLADDCIEPRHVKDSTISLSSLIHELQDETSGTGDTSTHSPAVIDVDKYADHKLEKEYNEIPFIILTNQCDAHLFIKDITLDGIKVTVSVGLGQRFQAPDVKYTILAIQA
jgi:hypothetical protein